MKKCPVPQCVPEDWLCGGKRCCVEDQKENGGKPLVSVIIPVLNGADRFGAALDSVLRQKYLRIELIVVDGGSSDGTLKMLQDMEQCIDLWISAPDHGVYDAMNRGLELAQGDWALFLGCDDQLHESFSQAIPFLTHSETIYYGDVIFAGNGKRYNGPFTPYMLMCRNMPHQAIFYPRLVIEKYRYNLSYPVLADYDMNLRCHGDTRLRFQYMPLVVAIFDERGGLSARHGDPVFEAHKEDILFKNFKFWDYRVYRLRSFFKMFERRCLRPLMHLFSRNPL